MSELPKNWANATLNDAISIVRNGKNVNQDKSGNGTPVSRIETISREVVNFERVGYTTDALDTEHDLLAPGDVLFSHINSATHLGKTAVFRDTAKALLHGINLLRIVPEPEAVDSEFFHQQCRFMRRQGVFELNGQHAVNQSSINQKRLKALPFLIPPLPEQRRIVAKLDRLSARSAAARDHLARTTKLATRAKQAILSAALSGELTRSWRETGAGDGWTDGQIDEIEGRRSAHAKSRRGSRLESDSGLTLSDLGALPQSWFPCHLAEIGKIQVGHAFKSAWFTADGPLLVRGANVAPGALSWEDTKRLDPDRAPDFEKFRLDEGDIVLAMDRPLISTGLKIARVDAASAGALLVQRVARITGRSHAELSYLWHVLNSRMFVRHAIERATGGDLPHISGNDILTTPVPLPPLDEQAEIVRRIEAAFARIDRMTEEASRAAHLLDRLDERLLAKAFRGELVPQDPEDESAEVLLTRIREARSSAPNARRTQRTKT